MTVPEARILRGPAGDVAEGGGIPWVFKAGSRQGDNFDFLVGDIPHFSGPPLHVHRQQIDTFYILQGVLTIQVEDDIVELSPGDYASVPAGVRHTFDNLDPEQPPVRAVNLMVPGGLDLFFEHLHALGQDPREDELNNVGWANGVSFVGPPVRVQLGLSAS